MTSSIIRGGFVIAEPAEPGGPVIRDGAVIVSGNLISDVGDFAMLRALHPAAEVIGSDRHIVIPGLIDTHSHGNGLSPLQRGGGYDFLENAQFDSWPMMPGLPRDLAAALTAVKHLRGGATTIHHTGWDDEDKEARARAATVIRTYGEIGIRCAYSPAARNRNKFCVGEKDFVLTLPEELAA